MNFKEKLPQNAGNRISEVLDFKISWGRITPDPLKVGGLVHQSTKPLDPPLKRGVCKRGHINVFWQKHMFAL
jgi:hypothetical protein